jgi:Zn-dependent protease with chaperone function
MLFPLLVLAWFRPDLSNFFIRVEGILPLLSTTISASLGSIIDFNPLVVLSFLRLEVRILHLIAQFSGILLMCGVTIASTLMLISRFFGQKIICSIQGIIEIEKGEIPELEHVVSRVSKKAGISMPRILLTEDLRPDAFTMGYGSSASLVFSVGLLATATPDEIEAISAHEIAHLKNRDSYVKLLIGWLRLFSFYNPIVHVAAGEVERERELLADQLAVSILGNPSQLLSSLDISTARFTRSKRVGVTTAFSSIFAPLAFTNHHPTPEQRSALVKGSRVKRTRKKWITWISVASMLILASVYLPAETAKAIRSPFIILPGWPNRPDHTYRPDPAPVEWIDESLTPRPPIDNQRASVKPPPRFSGNITRLNLDGNKTRFLPSQVERNRYEWLNTVVIATNLLRNIY